MSERAPQTWLERADALGRHAENALLVVIFACLVALSGYQIVLRDVFASGLFWADGVIRLGVLWLAVIGAIAASRDRKHIAIDLLTRALPVGSKRFVAFVVHAFTAGVTGFFAWEGGRFVHDSLVFEERLIAGWPAWILQLVLPVGFALIAYRYAILAIRQLRGERP